MDTERPGVSHRGRIAVAAGVAALLVAGIVLARGDEPTSSGDPPGNAPPRMEARPLDRGDIRTVLGPDQIPAIDDPRFVGADAVDFLDPREPVIVVEIEREAKAYPLRILTWHEIVNDQVGGTPVAVTYCPLCNTGIAFERPVIDGDLLDFGTSGKLLHSNLVMYDRQTDSLWPQATGEAIDGPLAGTPLEFVPAQIVSFADFAAAHPGGAVLSQDTGARRAYGTNPYVDYDESDPRGFLFDDDVDERLPAIARVLGVVAGDERMAFPYRELERRAVGGSAALNAEVGGRAVAVFWARGTVSAVDESSIPASRDVGAAGAFVPIVAGRSLTFEATPDGIVDRQTASTWSILGIAESGRLAGERLEPALAIDSFWFDWGAFFPETAVFGGEPD